MYLQTDPRWSSKTLDSVPYTIGRWGCTVTSIANGRLVIGFPPLTPKELSDRLSFTKDGLLLWGSLQNVGLKKVHYQYAWNPLRAKEALRSPSEFCVVEVDNYHWCLVWGTKLGLRLYDPLSGVRWMWPKYKKITKTVVLKKI